MPKFSWTARTRGGQSVSGDMDARSKDEVVAKLTAGQFVVTSVAEKPSRGEPEDPDRLSRGMQPPAVAEAPDNRPRPIRGLFLSAGILLIALAIGALAPVVVYECERTSAGAVNCSVHERIWGLIPIHDGSLTNISAVSEEERNREERQTKYRTVTVTESRVVLANASGAKLTPSTFTSSVYGTTSHDTYYAIDALMKGAQSERVVAWQAAKLTSAFSAGVALLALAMAALSLLSTSERLRNRVQQWSADVQARQKRR